jgi:hypothetical protein
MNFALVHSPKLELFFPLIITRTVSRIWERRKKSLIENPDDAPDVASRRCNAGRRPVIDVEHQQQLIRTVPICKRKTIADTASALGISASYFLL